MYRSMEVGDTARVITPSDATEYRLGTVTDVRYSTPHTTYALDYTLRFPNGTERTYPAEHVVQCTRTDDRAALEKAFTKAAVALRDACRIAHDFDADLSSETASLLRRLVDLARLHLGPTFDPAAWPHSGNQDGGDQ
ncbi:hypothetical protein O7626_30480 [Micromonospora sp. WMMD1102]|uniref:hypothetical protein n=1 Tax=Micromonospora sp. WMMD1102 TaxID=3016105 RepID=UPI0024150C60|nr:hypothetical protein [Micromonospora sp. WMMD1102]MDG4790199.1 hypothetical protein [Micromonospora sp. WMMD1102]